MYSLHYVASLGFYNGRHLVHTYWILVSR